MRLVYTATGKPVEIGDKHTIDGFDLVVSHAPKPHKPDSEGKITFALASEPEGPSGPTYYCSVIDAKWIEREDRAEPHRRDSYDIPPNSWRHGGA